jgi:acyl-coenzyme A thioesterase PaaI-like protein
MARRFRSPCHPVDITEIPFNRLVGMERAREPEGILSFPADVRYTNHLGTVHAGAMLALAEASSGEYLLREFGSLPYPVLPVVRRVEAKFRKPARGAIHSRVSVPPAERDAFVQTLVERGRALLAVRVDVHDDQGVHVLETTIEWFVARQEIPPTSTSSSP